MFLTMLAPGALAPVGTVPYIEFGGALVTNLPDVKVYETLL